MKLLPKAGAHRRRRARRRQAPDRPLLARLSRPRLPLSPATLPRPRLRPRPRWRRGPAERPVERRRARALLAAAVAFAAIVLFTTLPWTTLLNQHAQLSSATAEVNALQAENRVLSAQAHRLSDSATQAALARRDYGLVRPGQKAYDILPPAGSASSSATDAGHVPLNEPPVVPGSRRSEELLGAGVGSDTASTAAAGPTGTVHNDPITTGNARSASSGAGGFWTRVAHTLEFWS